MMWSNILNVHLNLYLKSSFAKTHNLHFVFHTSVLDPFCCLGSCCMVCTWITRLTGLWRWVLWLRLTSRCFSFTLESCHVHLYRYISIYIGNNWFTSYWSNYYMFLKFGIDSINLWTLQISTWAALRRKTAALIFLIEHHIFKKKKEICFWE